MPTVYVACTDTNCAENGVPKDNSPNYPLAEIQCGTCGGSVQVTAAPKA